VTDDLPTPQVLEDPPLPAFPTIGQDIKAGMLGLAIAVGCFFLIIPVLHFIAIASGPAVGGFFSSARIHARGKHAFIIGVTIGVGWTIVVGIVVAVLMVIGMVGQDTTSILMAVGAAVVAFFYSTTLGTVGAIFGGR
jgi:hypothetical protein